MANITTMALLLQLTVLMLACVCCSGARQMRRHKRDWLVPAKMLKENFDYRNSSNIARIRSDQDLNEKLFYSLTGPGADKKPYNLFVVDEDTGLVYVRGILDREEQENYTLTGVARFLNGTVAEGGIDLRFIVMDENDNPPVFAKVPPIAVSESSPPGTLVGTFTADDADKEGTVNAKIFYSIIKQEPPEDRVHFYIDHNTGSIYVKEQTLDRERHNSYTLTVKAVDMDGAPDGKSGTGTIEIKVTDINDNIPTLEKDEYSAQIRENVAKVEVLRIKALDKDEEKTDNWQAVFDIVGGNEDGIFSIETDPRTNEGILMLEKPVDFEMNPDIQLGVVVANVAPAKGGGVGAGAGADGGVAGDGEGGGEGEGEGEGDGDLDLGLGVNLDAGAGVGLGAGSGGGMGANAAGGAGGGANPAGGAGGSANPAGGAGGGPTGGSGAAAGAPGLATGANAGTKTTKKKKGKVYAVNIAVQNEPEGTSFKPEVMPVRVSENPEDLPEDRVIAVFRATDTDTGKPAENVIYAKAFDPENLLLIDPDTAEIKLQKVPDRESPFVVNGTYYAKILSMSKEMPYTTATGTLALQVGDANDNCPTLTSNMEYVCSGTHVVNITGQDEDRDPNGAPFSFSVMAEKTRGEWKIEPIDGSRASLHSLAPFWTGELHQILILVYDQQGLACPEPQTLEVHVCSCEGGDTCEPVGALGQRASLKESAATFGKLGVGAVILSLLALLLAVVLMAICRYGHGPFSEIPVYTEDHLMVYHTEGQGEDKDIPLLSSPVQLAGAAIYAQKSVRTTTQANMTRAYSSHVNSVETGCSFEDGGRFDARLRKCNFEGSRDSQGDVSLLDDCFRIDNMLGFALPDVFLHGYYSQKASFTAHKDSTRDDLLVYKFEGHGSPAGSVGSCSPLDSDDLQFLNNLEPKFKTLAEICAPPSPPAPPTPKQPPTPSTSLSGQVHHPPTTTRNTVLQTKMNKTMDSKVSRIHQQSSVHDQTISSTPTSTSITKDAPIQSKQKHILHSTNILQSPPVSPQSAALVPPLGQSVVLQEQPIYYIASPVLQQPMHYMVQPQIQNSMFFTGAQAPNLQGLVLLHNGSGCTEHIVHPGNAAWTMSLGRRRFSTDVEAGQASGSHNAGMSVGKKGRRMSEGCVNSGAYTDLLLAHNSKVATGSKGGQSGKKSQKKMSVETLTEQSENNTVMVMANDNRDN